MIRAASHRYTSLITSFNSSRDHRAILYFVRISRFSFILVFFVFFFLWSRSSYSISIIGFGALSDTLTRTPCSLGTYSIVRKSHDSCDSPHTRLLSILNPTLRPHSRDRMRFEYSSLSASIDSSERLLWRKESFPLDRLLFYIISSKYINKICFLHVLLCI